MSAKYARHVGYVSVFTAVKATSTLLDAFPSNHVI